MDYILYIIYIYIIINNNYDYIYDNCYVVKTQNANVKYTFASINIYYIINAVYALIAPNCPNFS